MTISQTTATLKIGQTIRATRKALGVTQKDLALTAGTGIRFIVDLEKGKSTCELGKVFEVLEVLGIQWSLLPPDMGNTHESS